MVNPIFLSHIKYPFFLSYHQSKCSILAWVYAQPSYSEETEPTHKDMEENKTTIDGAEQDLKAKTDCF